MKKDNIKTIKAFQNDTLADSNVLNAQEQEELCRLGDDIKTDLSCDANGTGLPCRTDRFSAVENMIRYLEIHGMQVIKDPGVWEDPSKSEREEGKKPFVVADARDQHLINKNFNKATGGK